MSGKRNVSVCSGHELANALYSESERIKLLKYGNCVVICNNKRDLKVTKPDHLELSC